MSILSKSTGELVGYDDESFLREVQKELAGNPQIIGLAHAGQILTHEVHPAELRGSFTAFVEGHERAAHHPWIPYQFEIGGHGFTLGLPFSPTNTSPLDAQPYYVRVNPHEVTRVSLPQIKILDASDASAPVIAIGIAGERGVTAQAQRVQFNSEQIKAAYALGLTPTDILRHNILPLMNVPPLLAMLNHTTVRNWRCEEVMSALGLGTAGFDGHLPSEIEHDYRNQLTSLSMRLNNVISNPNSITTHKSINILYSLVHQLYGFHSSEDYKVTSIAEVMTRLIEVFPTMLLANNDSVQLIPQIAGVENYALPGLWMQLRELVNNAIVNGASAVLVKIHRINGSLNIRVANDKTKFNVPGQEEFGPGIAFRAGVSKRPEGTELGTGYGLHNLVRFTESHGGSVRLTIRDTQDSKAEVAPGNPREVISQFVFQKGGYLYTSEPEQITVTDHWTVIIDIDAPI